MDQLDLDILAQLQRNGRKPYTEIAEAVGVSEGTVRHRVSRLVAQGAVQIVGMIDPHQLGFDAPAMIGVSLQGTDLEAVAAHIAAFPEVSYLVMVSGEYDLMVEVLCRNREHLASFLNQQLRKVPGVLRTETFMILSTFKMSSGAQPRIPARLLATKLAHETGR
jgi:Lrp/AsnC family transcriptional regulator for asnA, asnC and gidA